MNPTILEKKNKHERDNHISFDEGPHIYTIDGDSDYLSVTTWNHYHFPKFNADDIISKMMKSKNWKNSEYFGMSPYEIKQKYSFTAAIPVADCQEFLLKIIIISTEGVMLKVCRKLSSP